MSFQVEKVRRFRISFVPGCFLHSSLQAVGRSARSRRFPFTSVFRKRHTTLAALSRLPARQQFSRGFLPQSQGILRLARKPFRVAA